MNIALDTTVRNAHQLRYKDRVCRLSAYLFEPERVFDMFGVIEATGSGCRSYTSEGDHQCPIHGYHRAKVVLGYNPFGDGVEYIFIDGERRGYTYV